MNRVEFMRRLEDLLRDVPNSEREEAITYYNDYFNDAGVENEQEIIDALGSPERVADTIKAGLGGKVIDGEYTEAGYQDSHDGVKEEIAVKEKKSNQTKEQPKDYSKQKPNENKLLKVILYVLIAILLSPLWLPLTGGLFGILVAVIAVLFVCVFIAALIPFIVIIVGIACFLSGIVSFVVGIVQMFVAPAAAVGLLGIGLMLSGGGLLATVLGGWCLVKMLPPMIRGFVNLCRKPFTRKGGN